MKTKILLLTAFAILGITMISMAQIPANVPTNGLVGWWPFNGNANDLSGNGNNGTVNGASLTTDRFGIPNNAYSFDGVNDFIQSDTISALNSSINSISTWIYAPSFSVHHQIEFAAPTFGTLGRAFAFNTGRLAIVPTGNCVAASGAGVVNLSGQLGINSWYHLVFISDGSIGKFYINGVYIGQANIGSTICQNPLTLVLGRGTNGGGPMWYTGKIDDIGIWNRALTLAEITALYNVCADSISTEPTNQEGIIGGFKNFNVIHNGTGINYQWQSNSTNLGWQNVPNQVPYTGSNSNSLTINNLTYSNHNQLFRVISGKPGCTDTSIVVRLIISNITADSIRLNKLIGDSSRLKLDSINIKQKIDRLLLDSAACAARVIKLSYDSITHLSRITNLITDSTLLAGRIIKLTSDSVFYIGRINKLHLDSINIKQKIDRLLLDSAACAARIVKLSNDSIIHLSRITNLISDSIFLAGRIIKLTSDSIFYIGRINKLYSDSINYLNRINSLMADSINNINLISALNVQIGIKNNIIAILQNDTAIKADTINSLRLALINKHDTVYISSVITTDTLKISITTGLSPATGLINRISVYPNPASTMLYLDLQTPGYFKAQISGITGQTIVTPTSGAIDISNLSNGVYILSIYDQNNKLVSTNKVLIIR